MGFIYESKYYTATTEKSKAFSFLLRTFFQLIQGSVFNKYGDHRRHIVRTRNGGNYNVPQALNRL
jgi:hypothetical protein